MVKIAIANLTQNNAKPFILQAATGAGKSLVIADICHKLNAPVLVLQPSKELLEQNYEKLKSYGVNDISIYSASMNSKEIGKYTYATIGSIYKKPELFNHFKYVIIDECHFLNSKNKNGMLTSFLKAINCTKVCGLTATPYRIIQKYITEDNALYYTASLRMITRIYPFFFKSIAYKIETQELIDMGYLCPIKYYADTVDTSKLRPNTTGADFTDKSIEGFWDNKKLRRIAQACEYAIKHHKQTLVFCSSIRQAENAIRLAESLCGLRFALITGKTLKKERQELVEAYKRQEIKILFNVGVFTVGFDVPQLDCVILARPTMSLALYYQMVGRGVRTDPDDPNKMLTVYDLAGVVERLGRVESIRVQREAGGFRDEVWSERGRMDESPLFKWLVKSKR